RAGPGVTRGQTADRAGRLEEVLELQRGAGEAADETRDVVDTLRGFFVVRQRLEPADLIGGRLAYRLHQAVDDDLVPVVLQRRERPHQAPRGVGDDRRHRRVRVLLRAAHAQFEVRDALKAQRNGRPTGRVLVA